MRFIRQTGCFWSSVTCHIFSRLRPVATFVDWIHAGSGVKPPRTKAVTGHRTPKERRVLESEPVLMISAWHDCCSEVLDWPIDLKMLPPEAGKNS
jgi:hypothetical protein